MAQPAHVCPDAGAGRNQITSVSAAAAENLRIHIGLRSGGAAPRLVVSRSGRRHHIGSGQVRADDHLAGRTRGLGWESTPSFEFRGKAVAKLPHARNTLVERREVLLGERQDACARSLPRASQGDVSATSSSEKPSACALRMKTRSSTARSG